MDCILYVYSNMSRYISIRCNSDLSMFFPLQQVYTRRELNYTLFPSFLREWGKIRDWRRFMNIEMYAIPVELLKLLIVWNESWYEGSNLKFLDFSPQWNRGPANFIAMSESFAAIFRSSSRHPAPPVKLEKLKVPSRQHFSHYRKFYYQTSIEVRKRTIPEKE